MRLLLDTHAFLFAISDPDQLSAKVRELLLYDSVEKWVSAISLWEIAIKVQIGKLDSPIDGEFYVKQLRSLHAKALAVELRHSLAFFALPLHHRDPFDRLLIAQAKEEGLTIVTRDREFESYGVATLW
jgi:PIN domain nuclease of toxin-antitoxin system